MITGDSKWFNAMDGEQALASKIAAKRWAGIDPAMRILQTRRPSRRRQVEKHQEFRETVRLG